MKVTLIVPCSNLTNYGVRSISSFLKSKGHEVNIFFILVERNNFNGILSKNVLDQLFDLTKSSGLIGLSVMTNFLGYAQQITGRLRKSSVPIVWGGIQPTIDPQACLSYTDIICCGEGEETILDLVQALERGEPISNIENLWTSNVDGFHRNKVRPLIKDLDSIPDPDYDLSSHFIFQGDHFSSMNKEILKDNMIKMGNKSRYSVFTSRGCPAECLFCCNSLLKELYQEGGPFIRKRSVDRVIEELKNNVVTFGFESVCIQDEDFMVRTEGEIWEFCEKYKKEINLPFQCEFSPRTFNEMKIRNLICVGLSRVQIGIQSVDEETNKKLYHRNATKRQIEEVVCYFSWFSKIVTNLHFLVHNPWESEESLISSIKYSAGLPSWFNIKLYPLVFFPGTDFYLRAVREGLIKDFYKDVVYKDWSLDRIQGSDYLTLVFYLLNFLRNRNIPRKYLSPLISFLTSVLGRKIFGVFFIFKSFKYLLCFVHHHLGESRI